ncbi:MAG TPA: MarR family transcriptional regulator [Polyangiaceae bacterium]|jgi:DNA-binding MarR family transcriptional regulator
MKDDSRSVMDSLRLIVRDLRVGAREVERAAGVTGAQLFVLHQLAGDRALSLSDLAERTKTDPSSVSAIVKRLVAARLIVRRASKEDARRAELRLTPAGRRTIGRAPEPSQTRLLAAVARLRARDLAALRKSLRALVREMGLDDEAAEMFFEDGPSRRRRH